MLKLLDAMQHLDDVFILWCLTVRTKQGNVKPEPVYILCTLRNQIQAALHKGKVSLGEFAVQMPEIESSD